MLFQRFEDTQLSHYSYAVGCPAGDVLAVVDPRRDVDVYLDYAREQGLRIAYVLETHIHADFASGARELAQRSGAELLVSGHDEDETYQVSFPHGDLHDGDRIQVGNVTLQALHTPGHTPEHLSFLVFDETRSSETPLLMLSGDFLFVGSLGRPDLLGEEAKRGLAEQLFASVREKLEGLPDGLEVHPAHGAGSMCGSGMSGRPQSTLGFERRANPYLDPELGREAFIEKILGNVPPFPDYYRRMKQVNSEGPTILEGLPGDRPVELARFRQLVEGDHVVVDLREYLAFGGGHIPGSYGIGLSGNLSQWASWTLPYDTPVLLVAPDPAAVQEASRRLVRVGLDLIEGYLEGGIDTWYRAGLPLRTIPQVAPVDLHQRLADGAPVRVLDVRTDGEYASGHIAGARHIMAGELEDHLDDLPRDEGTLAVICGSGYRSTVAASILARAGFRDIANVPGGMRAWKAADLPVETD